MLDVYETDNCMDTKPKCDIEEFTNVALFLYFVSYFIVYHVVLVCTIAGYSNSQFGDCPAWLCFLEYPTYMYLFLIKSGFVSICRYWGLPKITLIISTHGMGKQTHYLQGVYHWQSISNIMWYFLMIYQSKSGLAANQKLEMYNLQSRFIAEYCNSQFRDCPACVS